MGLLNRNLLASLVAGLVTIGVPAVAAAQDEDEPAEEGDEPPAEEGDDEIPPPSDEPAPEGGEGGDTWGVGGEEPEGRFTPKGRTGKLKELEEEHEEEREVEEGPPDLPPPGFAYLDTALGFGDIVVIQYEDGATAISTTASFLIGVGYRIGDTWQVYTRFPISTGINDGPQEPFPPDVDSARNPDRYKQIATGNLEIGVKPHFILNRDMRLPVGLGITFPTSQGDMFARPGDRADLGRRIVNLAASASRGWEDRALFASKRLSFIPSVGFLWKLREIGPGNIRLEPETKFEIMIKTGGTDPFPAGDLPPGSSTNGEFNDVAFNWVLNLDAWYDVFDGLLQIGITRFRFAAGTAEEKRIQLANPDETTLAPDGFQFVWEPTLGSHVDFTDDESFGMDFRVGYMIPGGGELGGGNSTIPASVGGLRLRAGFFF